MLTNPTRAALVHLLLALSPQAVRLPLIKHLDRDLIIDMDNLLSYTAYATPEQVAGTVLICGIHNAAHQRSALVPLRWGAPRIVVMSGGFFYHLGKDLKDEPFRAARLWRYQGSSNGPGGFSPGSGKAPNLLEPQPNG